MNIDKSDTAVVFIDPQNEVLSETGLAWPLLMLPNSQSGRSRVRAVARISRGQVSLMAVEGEDVGAEDVDFFDQADVVFAGLGVSGTGLLEGGHRRLRAKAKFTEILVGVAKFFLKRFESQPQSPDQGLQRAGRDCVILIAGQYIVDVVAQLVLFGGDLQGHLMRSFFLRRRGPNRLLRFLDLPI
jgi:hypothetical protein